MAGSNVTPAVNETTAPFQFDNSVLISGADTRGGPQSQPYTQASNSGGLISTNFPTYLATGTGSAVQTAGTLNLAMINLAANTTVSNLWINVITAANGLTSGQCFGGLYYAGAISNLSLATTASLVASTANLSATIGTATGFIKLPLTTAFTSSGGGAYYVGLYTNGGTTPVLGCFSGFVTITTSAGTFTKFPNTSASQYPFAVNGTSITTAGLPTSLTLTSNSTTGAFCFWTGVS